MLLLYRIEIHFALFLSYFFMLLLYKISKETGGKKNERKNIHHTADGRIPC